MVKLIGKPITILTGIEFKFGNSSCTTTTSSSGGGGDKAKPLLKDGSNANAMMAFEREYEDSYGTVHVPFFKGSFEQAKQEAKSRKAILLTCFLSKFHEATPIFLRETLGDPVLSQFLSSDDGKFIFWIADVYYPYAYNLATLMEGYIFPSIVFFANVNNRMVPLQRLDGFCTAERLKGIIVELMGALAVHEKVILGNTQNQTASQRIRAEQDAAYFSSLQADARKAKERNAMERQEIEAAKERESIKEALRVKKMERKKLIDKISSSLPMECESDDDEAIKLSLQLLDGKRVIRKFNPTNPVSTIYDWAFSLIGTDHVEINPEDITIRTVLPPIYFSRSEKSLIDSNITTRTKLIVEVKDE